MPGSCRRRTGATGTRDELTVSTIFAPVGEATELEVTMKFPSREVRDLLIKAGMNDEAAGQYRRLDAVLAG